MFSPTDTSGISVDMLTRISLSTGYLLQAPMFEAGAMWKSVSSRQTRPRFLSTILSRPVLLELMRVLKV